MSGSLASTAAQQWTDELAAWAIDPEILAAAPESPYGFEPSLFAPVPDSQPTPLQEVAAAAMRPGDTVLDVGAGAGATSLAVVPPSGHLHAVDSQPSMLRALEATAADQGVEVTTYDGRWPDVADEVPVCDVAVCSHVLYNVPDLVPFVTALSVHARRLVVVEISERHPLVRLAPLWEAVHHQPRPSGPTAELVLQVLRDAGLDPDVREQVRPPVVRTGAMHEEWVDFTCRQLCLPRERRAEVEALMREHPFPPRRWVALSWPGSAPAQG
jgi:methyltransferase family protein